MNKLPTKCLLQFRRVSKLWKFTIDSSIFIRDYGSRQCETCCFNLAYKRSTEGFMCSVDEQMSYTPLLNTNLYLSALTPITTSEGVWCFSYGSHMGAILWNPSIRKSIGIVIPYMTSQPEIRKIVWGFGVRSDTLDPTFLNISMGKYGAGPWHVFVYTLSSNSWNSLENYRLPRVSIRIKRSCGQTTVSGFIFWGGYEIFFNVDGSCYNISMLVSFDMINHQFHVLDIPSVLRDQLPDPFYISHLGNSLVISGNLIIFENRYICAWLLEVDGYNVTSWRMLFVIPSTNVVKLIGFTKDDDPIVEVDRGRMLHPLQVYDRASEEFHNVGISADGGSFFIGPYKESLILLNV
ncbi:F-box domain containing protein [Tanacetum coccineum]|uniref:F-box domain-containing protein n=1 Tax=Tanacetum coccineum TaxID=301880 RepID=A0ABQ5G955_9ASTR